MRDETELERLQRQVEKSKAMVHQSGIKVEELEASMHDIYRFKDRLTVFPRNGDEKLPAPTDEPAGCEKSHLP
jgi:hypothetical protein